MLVSAAPATTTRTTVVESVATPSVWAITIAAVIALLALDFVITRRPHDVSLKEAIGWSAFYVALPLLFAVWVWRAHGADRGVEYLTGYLVEKSLSVDNLFVFMILLAAFGVPRRLQQRALLYGIVGALVLRGIFIGLGAAAIARFDVAFLVFGLVLLLTAVKILRDARAGTAHEVDVDSLRSVRLLRRFVPVTEQYDGPRLLGRVAGRRAVTPFAVVVVAMLATDVVFAVDSVPAVYGITSDPYLVFVTNAFALLGLRALYFVLEGALAALVHLGYGLAAILGFIGTKLVLHWAHVRWESVPEVPTLLSLGVILGVLAVTTVTSLVANRRSAPDAPPAAWGSGTSSRRCTPMEVGREELHAHMPDVASVRADRVPLPESARREEHTMPSKSANVKNEKQYEALKDKGMSKERAAKIANSPGASKKGGKKSHSGSGNSSQGGTHAQKAKAGRKGGKASHS